MKYTNPPNEKSYYQHQNQTKDVHRKGNGSDQKMCYARRNSNSTSSKKLLTCAILGI